MPMFKSPLHQDFFFSRSSLSCKRKITSAGALCSYSHLQTTWLTRLTTSSKTVLWNVTVLHHCFSALPRRVGDSGLSDSWYSTLYFRSIHMENLNSRASLYFKKRSLTLTALFTQISIACYYGGCNRVVLLPEWYKIKKNTFIEKDGIPKCHSRLFCLSIG